MRSGKDAAAYGDELRRIVRFLGISDGNMSEGSMRCDVNISVSGCFCVWRRGQAGCSGFLSAAVRPLSHPGPYDPRARP